MSSSVNFPNFPSVSAEQDVDMDPDYYRVDSNSSTAKTPLIMVIDMEQLEYAAIQALPPQTFVFVVDGILQTILMAIGVIGNLLMLPVYMRPQVWSSINYYIIALTLFDLALLVSYFSAMTLWVVLLQGHVKSYGWHVEIVHISFVIANIARTATIWITALLTIERYFAICHPFWHIRVNKKLRIKVCVSATSILAIAYNLIRIFEYETREMSVAELFEPILEELRGLNMANDGQFVLLAENKTVPYLEQTALYRSKYFIGARFVCRVIFDTVVPVILIACLTFQMSYVLIRATKRRELYTRNSQSYIDCSTLTIAVRNDSVDSRTLSATHASNRSSIESQNVHGPPLPPQAIPAPTRQNSSLLEAVTKMTVVFSNSNDDPDSKSGDCEGKPQTLVYRAGSGSATPKQLVVRRCSTNSQLLNMALIILFLKFLLSHVLPAVTTIMEMAMDQKQAHLDALSVLTTIANLLVVFNSSTNWIVFLVYGAKFRAEFKEVVVAVLSKLICRFKNLKERCDK